MQSDNSGDPGVNQVETKIVFLVVASGGIVFSCIRQAQKFTWVHKLNRGSSVLFLKGNGKLGPGAASRFDLYNPSLWGNNPVISTFDAELIRSDLLIIESSNGWDQILTNTLAAMTWVEKNLEYDYLIRTNVSTFWNLRAVYEMLYKPNPEPLYLGHVTTNLGITYVEGDGIILSQSCVRMLLNNKKLIDFGIIDDVSLGIALQKMGVSPKNLDRPWIRRPKHLSRIEGPSFVNTVSFRCKSEFHFLGMNLRLDPILMFLIWMRLRWFN
jgi:hypothetical protein